jgi:TRAP-type C4-dicarboxylate transport system substrate-binding protein
MKKSVFILIVLLMVAAVIITGCGEPEPAPPPPPEEEEEAPPPTEPPEVIELNVAVTTPPMAAPAEAVTRWAEKFEELSGGRVKFTIYYSSSLFEAKEALRSVLAGVADISDLFPGAVPGAMPLAELTWMPGLDWPHPEKSTLLYRELLNKFPELTAEYQGVKILYPTLWGQTTTYIHTTKKPVKSVADLKGMKLQGSSWEAKWQSLLGATPVFVSYEDVYMAVERGLIEGHFSIWGAMEGGGIVELAPYHTDMGTTSSIGYNPLIMNPDSWNRLPPDIQKIFGDLDDFYTPMRIDFELEAETRLVKYTKEELGHTYFTLPPEDTKLLLDTAKPLHEEWIESVEARGLPGRAIYEELTRLIAEYK